MPPQLTLLSFAALNSPNQLTGRKRKILEPNRWCPMHLDILKVTIEEDEQVLGPKNTTFSFSTAEERDQKREKLKNIETLLLELEFHTTEEPDFYDAAWTILTFLSQTKSIRLGPTPIGYVNSRVLHAFAEIIGGIIGSRLELIARCAENNKSLSRALTYRNQTVWLTPDMCIAIIPKGGAPISIPVFYPELHRRPRTPLAPEIAFILACAQKLFRDLDVSESSTQNASVRVVVLRVAIKETFFVSAVVSKSYLDSVEQAGTPDVPLEVMTSPKWNLKTGNGRLGFFVGLKQAAESMLPKARSAKRKSNNIS